MTADVHIVAPTEMVSQAKRDLALLAMGARLFQQFFAGELSEIELYDAAIDLGLTEDREVDCDELGVDTVVELSREFMDALAAVEKAAGLVPQAEPEAPLALERN